MTSVTRFLKQVSADAKYYPIAQSALVGLASSAYELVPQSGNVVGNYPPGIMVQATTGNNPSLYYGITSLVPTAGSLNTTMYILRDMGKTVFAPASNGTVASAAATTPATTGLGFYRQVQLLVPEPVVAGQIGGPSGSVFGVYGSSPDGYTPYLTFYVPSVVAGVLGLGSLTTLYGTQGSM